MKTAFKSYKDTIKITAYSLENTISTQQSIIIETFEDITLTHAADHPYSNGCKVIADTSFDLPHYYSIKSIDLTVSFDRDDYSYASINGVFPVSGTYSASFHFDKQEVLRIFKAQNNYYANVDCHRVGGKNPYGYLKFTYTIHY